jgi:hypothetical protein
MVGKWWEALPIMPAPPKHGDVSSVLAALSGLALALAAFLGGSTESWSVAEYTAFFALTITVTAIGYFQTRRAAAVEERQETKIETLEKKAQEEPEKARPAWELARATLEKYFQRNLNQVRMIFYAAIFVMLVGFGFVLWGVREAVLNPNQVKIAIIASASGVITQFIGLTFMAIYRSTMLQAAQYMSILERINTVGMAVQILDAMTDTTPELKDSTRVDIIRLLLAVPDTRIAMTPGKRKAPERRTQAKEKAA